MARTGVTYYDVANAAMQLQQQGLNPTVDRVREGLGGTGSKSTIAPLLKEWKANQDGQRDIKETGLPTDLVTSVKGLYEGLQQQARAQIETVESLAASQLKEKNEALQTAENTIQTLKAQLTEAQQDNTQLKQVNDALKTELQETQQELITTNAKLTAAGERLADRDQEISRLNTQFGQAQQNLEHYRESVNKQRQQERKDFEQQMVMLNQTLAQVQQQLVDEKTRADAVSAELVKQESMNDLLLKDNTDQQAQLKENEQRFQKFQQDFSEVAAHLAVNKDSLQQASQKLINLEKHQLQHEKHSAVLESNLAELTSKNDKLEGQIEGLRLENSILLQEKAAIEGQFRQLQKSLISSPG